MRYEIKTLSIWSFVRVSSFLNLVVGFVIGLIYAAMLGLIFAAAGSLGEVYDGAFDPSAFGPFLLMLLPFIFAVGGAVFNTVLGVIFIAAYNLIARMVGGFEMTLEPLAEPPTPFATVPTTAPPPTWNPPPPPPSDPSRDRGPEQS